MIDEKHRGGFLTNRRRLLKTGGVFAGASALLGSAPALASAGSSAESATNWRSAMQTQTWRPDADRYRRRGEESPRSEQEHGCESESQSEQPSAKDDIPATGEAAERQQRERVVCGRGRSHARLGQRHQRCGRRQRDWHGYHRRARTSAHDPQAETQNEERQGRDDVSLADVVEILDREERYLGDEQNDVSGRHREKGAHGRVFLAVRRCEDDERRGGKQRKTERHRDEDTCVPCELRRGSCRGSRRLGDLSVRAEQVTSP